MGWLISGSMRYENREGEADMSIPISGPDGSGSIRIEAVKQGAEVCHLPAMPLANGGVS